MPDKTLRPNATREEIVQHHAQEGTLPRPFAPFMGDGDSLAPPPPIGGGEGSRRSSVGSFLSSARNSFLSGNSNSRRFSVASVATTASSGAVTTAGGGTLRNIRQIFNPVLPDELVISVGERVTGTCSKHTSVATKSLSHSRHHFSLCFV